MRTVLIVASAAALMFAPAAHAGDSMVDTGFYSVAGEKIDSGLGNLAVSYDAAEYRMHVAGESLDNGLGDLPASYTAAEFRIHVAGESLDSGLGDLPAGYTAAEFWLGDKVLGAKIDSGLGELSLNSYNR